MRTVLFAVIWICLSGCQATSAPNNAGKEAAVINGFSTERLERINTVMQGYIDQGKLAGIMTLIAKDGKVVHKSVQGMQDREAGVALSEDSIFRIYSMTKPVTAVAALTLWEQGKFHMQDPIAMYLPELADLNVYVSGEGENIKTEKAKGPIRIIDLFMHTAGFSYGLTGSEVDKLYRASPAMQGKVARQDILTEIAKLPLNHQPGTQWHYGINIDIIGFLVEKLTGQSLGAYMQETIFDPLNMTDTGFYVKAESVGRFVQVYTADQKGQTVVMENEPLGDYLSDPAIHNGGGGLVSTAADYLKFAQMLLNGGELNGVRILGRKTVEYMASNHLPANLIPFAPDAQGEGYGLGVSVTVDTGMAKFMSSEGNYGWGGMASTYFRIDPQENLIIMGLSQFIPIGFHRYHDDLRNLTYQALVE